MYPHNQFNGNNANQMNQAIQSILSMKNAGRNPQQIMQMLMQQNPNVRNAMTTLQNMAQGKNPQEFLMQLARQNGINEQNMQGIMSLFNNNRR